MSTIIINKYIYLLSLKYRAETRFLYNKDYNSVTNNFSETLFRIQNVPNNINCIVSIFVKIQYSATTVFEQFCILFYKINAFRCYIIV